LAQDGTLKIADLGSIRDLTRAGIKLTLPVLSKHYRPPELLLGATQYTNSVDMWSVGCLFYELLTYRRLFEGHVDHDVLVRIFERRGTPAADVWQRSYANLSGALDPEVISFRRSSSNIPPSTEPPFLSELVTVQPSVSSEAADLLLSLLDWDPTQRISAADALQHRWFQIAPKAKPALPPRVDTAAIVEQSASTTSSSSYDDASPSSSMPFTMSSPPPLEEQ
jgi:serine/threonine protein kinase